ncbi:MAG TPA: DoxX family protein [Planctomycetota bacterium]|nr:DoxX family protein [Planctomycetota bacterium]
MNASTMKSLYERFAVRTFDRLRDPLLLLLRITWGWMFFQTGFGKLGNLAGTTGFFTSLGLPMPFVNAVVVGTLECVGGLLLIGGVASRVVAMLLAGNMLVAYLTAHRDAFGSLRAFVAADPYPFLLAALLVLAFGPGRLSIDAWLRPAAGRSDRLAEPRAMRGHA